MIWLTGNHDNPWPFTDVADVQIYRCTNWIYERRKISDGGWRAISLLKFHPESCIHTPHSPARLPPALPLPFHSPTQRNRVAAALSSYTNIPTEKGQKTLYPFLLTILPPPPPKVVLGQKRVSHLTFSLSLPLPPPISHNRTHTHMQIGTLAHTQTELTRSTAVHEVTNWGLCLPKGGGEPLLHMHTHIHTLSRPPLL